jgi:hypothetical protein
VLKSTTDVRDASVQEERHDWTCTDQASDDQGPSPLQRLTRVRSAALNSSPLTTTAGGAQPRTSGSALGEFLSPPGHWNALGLTTLPGRRCCGRLSQNCPHGRPTMRHLTNLTDVVKRRRKERKVDWEAVLAETQDGE